MGSLKKLIPFLNRKELIDLLNKVLASKDLIYQEIKMKNILPFLEEEDIDQLFVNLLKDNRDITEFLPFVGKQTLKNIIELYCFDKLNYTIDINKFIPYIDEESISLLYKKLTN